jgi:hypothetical protein
MHGNFTQHCLLFYKHPTICYSKEHALLFYKHILQSRYHQAPICSILQTLLMACPGQQATAPFGCADKKHGWLIYCERKTLFRLKKQAEKYEL